MKDWVKIGQSYTHGDDDITPLSGDKDSPPRTARGIQVSRSEGRRCKAADFFSVDDEPSPRKSSSSPSEHPDSGRDMEDRHHRRGKDRLRWREWSRNMNLEATAPQGTNNGNVHSTDILPRFLQGASGESRVKTGGKRTTKRAGNHENVGGMTIIDLGEGLNLFHVLVFSAIGCVRVSIDFTVLWLPFSFLPLISRRSKDSSDEDSSPRRLKSIESSGQRLFVEDRYWLVLTMRWWTLACWHPRDESDSKRVLHMGLFYVVRLFTRIRNRCLVRHTHSPSIWPFTGEVTRITYLLGGSTGWMCQSMTALATQLGECFSCCIA